MKWLGVVFGVAIVTACVNSAGCGGAAASPTLDPRALARGTVETLETVWNTEARACVDVAAANSDEHLLDVCKEVLNPQRQGIIAAAEAVDAWDDASQKNFPCMIANIEAGLGSIRKLLQLAGVTLPQVVNDGFTLADMYTPVCKTVDAGGQ